MLAEILCKECDGSGWNGFICGHHIVCRICGGHGNMLTEYMMVMGGIPVSD